MKTMRFKSMITVLSIGVLITIFSTGCFGQKSKPTATSVPQTTSIAVSQVEASPLPSTSSAVTSAIPTATNRPVATKKPVSTKPRVTLPPVNTEISPPKYNDEQTAYLTWARDLTYRMDQCLVIFKKYSADVKDKKLYISQINALQRSFQALADEAGKKKAPDTFKDVHAALTDAATLYAKAFGLLGSGLAYSEKATVAEAQKCVILAQQKITLGSELLKKFN